MNTTDMPVIELAGSPRERGRHYGGTAKELIADIVQGWRGNLGSFAKNQPTSVPADQYLKAFYEQTDYLSGITQWAPDLLEEVKGIAEGSEQNFKDILGVQLADEEWIFGLRRGLDKPTEKCTAFGVPDADNGVSYAGQNLDVGRWIDDKQVLLRDTGWAARAALMSSSVGLLSGFPRWLLIDSSRGMVVGLILFSGASKPLSSVLTRG